MVKVRHSVCAERPFAWEMVSREGRGSLTIAKGKVLREGKTASSSTSQKGDSCTSKELSTKKEGKIIIRGRKGVGERWWV